MTNYQQTDQVLHQLSQLLAKTNRAFVEARKDDSHTNLAFDPWGNRLISRWFDGPQGKVALTIELEPLQLILIDQHHQQLLHLSIPGNTIQQLESQLELALVEIGLAKQDFSAPMHYDLPDYDLADQPIAALDSNALNAWTQCRAMANAMCYELLTYLQEPGEPRIWPHHFDTGIYVTANQDLGIGFGLAMHDAQHDSAYFYLSGYPLNGKQLNYDKAPEITCAQWVTGSFNGAVLPISELEHKKDAAQLIRNYVLKSIRWLIQ